MRKITPIVIIAILGAIMTSGAQDLQEILKKHFETIGQEKVLDIQNITFKGTIVQMGMELTFTNIVTRSGKLMLEVPFQGQLMKRAFDGEVGWMIAPWSGSLDPVELSDLEKKMMKNQADIDGMLYDSEKKGYKTEYIGEEDMEGTPVYAIKLTDESGDEYINYLDAENYVILKVKNILNYQGSKLEVETYMSNYKPIEGMIMPFSMESRMNGQTQSQIVISEVLFDQDIPDTIFEKPAVQPKPDSDQEK